MATPLGDFVRAQRDSTQPEDLGLPVHDRRRAPGLRRTELAARARISVEYLTRIEQGRDRNPSGSIVNALADALSLSPAERTHLRYLAKISGEACAGHQQPEPPQRTMRPRVRDTLSLLEPGVAMVTNRLGDVLAHTSGFELLMRGTGLLDTEHPNLTSYVFTHPLATTTFPDWGQIADEQVFNLWRGPSLASFEWFTTELAPLAGAEFTRRLDRHLPPPPAPLTINHHNTNELRWDRETLELPDPDNQQLVVLLPADNTTATAFDHLRRSHGATLHAV